MAAGKETYAGTDKVKDVILTKLDGDLAELFSGVAALTAGSGSPVSSDDTTPGYLDGKIQFTGAMTYTVLNPAANEVLEIGVTLPTGATTSTAGVTTLSTDNLAITGSNTSTVLTPANLKAALNQRTHNKNHIINGNMAVSQRGTAFTSGSTITNNDDTYLLDQWILLSDGNDIVDVTQESSGGVSGTDKYIRLDVETAQKKFGVCQVIEAKNCTGLLGSTGSLSFEARVSNASKLSDIRAVVLAWASTADVVTSDVVGTWEAEGSNPVWTGSWTAENTPADLSVTTSWVKYTIENIAIDTSNATNIAVFIWQNNVATNDTTGVTFDITNVQLEDSPIATTFEYEDINTTLVKCQRYWNQSYNTGVLPGTASESGGASIFSISNVASNDHTVHLSTSFPTTMRTTPTITVYDMLGGAGKCRVANGNNITANVVNIGFLAFDVWASNGAASTSRTLQYQYTATAEL